MHRPRVPFFFFFQAEDGIRDATVTGVQTCALLIFTTIKAKGEAAEWDAEAAVGPEVVVAGREAAVDTRAVAVAAVVNVVPRNRAPMARKFSSGFPKKRVDVSLKSLRRKPSEISMTTLSRNYASNTTWALRPIKTARPPVIITLS